MDTAFRFSQFSLVQKRAVFKIAIELVKADNRIHRKEITVLDNLQKELEISQQEIDLIHYTSLDNAVETIGSMPDDDIESILALFSGIMKADSDIDFEENLLLSSIILSCGKSSRSWSKVVSASDLESEISGNQIIYLEKRHSEATHAILDDKYDNLLISKAFGDIGFQFFYLPSVLSDLGIHNGNGASYEGRFGLLQKSMGYLMPAGDKIKMENLESVLSSFDTSTFFKVILSRLNVQPDMFPYESFILIKIRDSVLLDDDSRVHNTVDFLCIDLSTDVKKRILEFVSMFDEQTLMLPYDGYYKFLYDYFSSESKITSSILIDGSFNFCLENIGNRKVVFESAPQAKTLYLLLLRYGKNGVSQETFTKALDYLKAFGGERIPKPGSCADIAKFKKDLSDDGSEHCLLIYNTIEIYQSISTKDEQSSNFLSYISSILAHRSSLKTYINKGFSEVEGLSNPEQYFICFDKRYNTYSVPTDISLFSIVTGDGIITLDASRIWKALK